LILQARDPRNSSLRVLQAPFAACKAAGVAADFFVFSARRPVVRRSRLHRNEIINQNCEEQSTFT